MSKYSFRKYQPLSLRLWHWLSALMILGLLGTVLLRKTLLSWRTNAALIQEKLKDAGTEIAPNLAREIAVAIRDPLWDWHINMGLVLGALFLGRILIALFVEKQFFGVEALKSVSGLREVPAAEKANAIHFTLVKIIYAVFYLAIAFMVITGFMLTYETELGLSKELARTTKENHEMMTWFFVVFVGVHLLGVILTEVRKAPGIVSDMINGGDGKRGE